MTLQFRVRVAWTTDPFSASPSWTDESGRVDVGSSSIDITRGSGDLDETVNPGTLSLTFDNHDGRFTVGYTGGALYPNVVIGKRIHVDSTVDAGAHWFDRFDGFLDTLPMQWAPSGRYAEAQVTAVDYTKKLSKQLVSDDIVSLTILADSPQDYWRFDEAETATGARNSGTSPTFHLIRKNIVDPRYDGITFGADGGSPTDGTGCAEVMGEAYFYDSVNISQAMTTRWCIEGVFTFISSGDTLGGYLARPFFLYDGANFMSVRVDYTNPASGTLNASIVGQDSAGAFTVYDSHLGSSTDSTPVSLHDGQPHHFVLTYDGVTALLSLWIDGEVRCDQTLGANLALTQLWLGQAALSLDQADKVQVCRVATYNGLYLSQAQIEAHASAALNGFSLNYSGFVGETSAARFHRIVNLGGISSVLSGGSTSSVVNMGPLSDIKGQSYLELLQAVQDTEAGSIYVSTTGVFTYILRPSLYNQAASATFPAGSYTPDLQFISDDSRIVNDVTVTGVSGTPQEVTNATSITALGTYSLQKDLNVVDDETALAWANWLVNVSNTNPRCPQVVIDLLSNQSLLPGAWAVDISDLITITGLPSTAPSTSLSLLVDGYTESYSLSSYTITFNTDTPSGLATIFTFDDATLGLFDGVGVLAF